MGYASHGVLHRIYASPSNHAAETKNKMILDVEGSPSSDIKDSAASRALNALRAMRNLKSLEAPALVKKKLTPAMIIGRLSPATKSDFFAVNAHEAEIEKGLRSGNKFWQDEDEELPRNLAKSYEEEDDDCFSDSDEEEEEEEIDVFLEVGPSGGGEFDAYEEFVPEHHDTPAKLTHYSSSLDAFDSPFLLRAPVIELEIKPCRDNSISNFDEYDNVLDKADAPPTMLKRVLSSFSFYF